MESVDFKNHCLGKMVRSVCEEAQVVARVIPGRCPPGCAGSRACGHGGGRSPVPCGPSPAPPGPSRPSAARGRARPCAPPRAGQRQGGDSQWLGRRAGLAGAGLAGQPMARAWGAGPEEPARPGPARPGGGSSGTILGRRGLCAAVNGGVGPQAVPAKRGAPRGLFQRARHERLGCRWRCRWRAGPPGGASCGPACRR